MATEVIKTVWGAVEIYVFLDTVVKIVAVDTVLGIDEVADAIVR
jgi:hypothetical protein